MAEQQLVGILKLSDRQRIQVGIELVRGEVCLGLRYFFETDDGTWLPIAKGFSVPGEKATELRRLVNKACKQLTGGG